MKSPEQKERAPEYTIRGATPADAAAIARIHHDSWLATYPNEEAKISLEDVQIYLGDIQERREVEKIHREKCS